MGRLTQLRSGVILGRQCFICHKLLHITGGTEEHVVPRWVSRRYGLWNAEYEFAGGLNGYRLDRLKVPCCDGCNKRLGRHIEEPMRQMVAQGGNVVDPNLVRIWLAKITSGAAVLQAQHAQSRRRAGERLPVDTTNLEAAFGLHRKVLLNVGKVDIKFDPSNWSSLFVYKTQLSPDNDALNFDYIDDPTSRVVAVRCGPLGMLAFLFDGGAVASIDSHFYRGFAAQPLAPFQFRELIAYAIAVGESKLRGVPISAMTGQRLNTITLRLTSDLRGAVRGQLDPDHLSSRLAYYWHMDKSDVMNRDGRGLTSLYTQNGEPITLGFHDGMSLDAARRWGKPLMAPEHWTKGRRRT